MSNFPYIKPARVLGLQYLALCLGLALLEIDVKNFGGKNVGKNKRRISIENREPVKPQV